MTMMGSTSHVVSPTANKCSLKIMMMKNAFGGITSIDIGGLGLAITLAQIAGTPTLLMMFDVLVRVMIGEEEDRMNI